MEDRFEVMALRALRHIRGIEIEREEAKEMPRGRWKLVNKVLVKPPVRCCYCGTWVETDLAFVAAVGESHRVSRVFKRHSIDESGREDWRQVRLSGSHPHLKATGYFCVEVGNGDFESAICKSLYPGNEVAREELATTVRGFLAGLGHDCWTERERRGEIVSFNPYADEAYREVEEGLGIGEEDDSDEYNPDLEEDDNDREDE
ncbi:MAG: hypothetical protein L0Y56_11660 [Nitrospira sp.]|nr:hypothetical protein [Nitrospira sp.]